MDTPPGHEENADQIAYWNGPGGQRWADRQPAQDILLRPVADLLIDRAKPEGGRARHRCRLRQRRDHDRVRAEGGAVRPCVRHRRIRPDAGAGAADRAEGSAGRFRAGGCDRLSVRSRKLRSAGLAVRRDVLRRSRAVLRQSAPGAAAVGAAGIRLLARAARKSVLHGAAAGGLQARPETAAAGAGRSRSVRVCLRGARAPHPGRGRLHRRSRWSRAISRSMSRSAAGSRPRCRARSKSDRRAARWRAIRRRSAPPPPIRSARRWRRSSRARRCRLPASIWIVTARA